MALHCQIAEGAKFRVKERGTINKNLGVLSIIKNKNKEEKDKILWKIVWDSGIKTKAYPLPWTEYCELYETDEYGYCLCSSCICKLKS